MEGRKVLELWARNCRGTDLNKQPVLSSSDSEPIKLLIYNIGRPYPVCRYIDNQTGICCAPKNPAERGLCAYR